MAIGPAPTEVREGDLLWTPTPERAEGSNLTAFTRWLRTERAMELAGYDDLWRWSVTDLEAFWGAIWDYFDIQASTPPSRVLGRRDMPGAEWFPGARLNYAESFLRREQPGSDALVFLSETAPLAGMPWEDLAGQVRVLATWLRGAGVEPGDRVVSFMPNIPQTVVAMLATTSIGAIWASCSPDFGWRGVLDRFQQLAPKVLFGVDGYRYGGREFDRREELRQIVAGLPSLEHVVHLRVLHPEDPPPAGDIWLGWEVVLDRPPVPAERFEFEQVAFDHPLWVLFSSGTTGWMMWNFLVSSPLLGVVPVLYDGNPAYPDAGVLWKMAQDSRATLFGASPAYVELMRKAGIVPGEQYDLSALRTIMPAGSPVSPECTEWFYRSVKRDLWVATGSGGTDTCCGFVGGVPTLPVYAGEMQARSLGVAAQAFDDRGDSVVDEVGELVITQPMPSMPVRLWGDEDGRRYRETYFADYPGVWRHGDFFRINGRGGCFVLGRSDATLNRHGVRIGTAEVYRTLAGIEEIDDALVVNLDLPGGRAFMPLFVKLGAGRRLDAALEEKIRDRLRREYTPRHVPDRIVQVPEIPATLTGKKMEVPIRKILLGVPVEEAANRHAMANPHALDDFVTYAHSQRDYKLD